jgi:hypothetical protein
MPPPTTQSYKTFQSLPLFHVEQKSVKSALKIEKIKRKSRKNQKTSALAVQKRKRLCYNKSNGCLCGK